MCRTSAHGTTNGSAYAIWWAMLCGTSTQTDRGCTRCPIFMRSLRSQPLSSAWRLKNNTREQHECTNLMHSDLGQIMEMGSTEQVSTAPLHPYTQALFASTPSMNPDERLDRPPLMGDPPNPINPPSGCRFRTRCPHAM